MVPGEPKNYLSWSNHCAGLFGLFVLGVMQGFAVHILGCFVFRVSDLFAPVSVCSPNMPRVDSFLTSGTSQCVCCPQSRVQSLGFQIR